MESLFKAVGAVVLVALIISIAIYISNADKRKINTWAKDNGMVKVVSIEKPWIAQGPFWIKEDHHRIYKVIVIDNSENERITWFRFGDWSGYDQEWEK